MKPACLKFGNGEIFEGFAPKKQEGTFFGEIVFTTGMTGYPETLTDPSFKGQIVVFTYPLIGNYGVPSKEHWESGQIQAAGVVLSDLCLNPSHNKKEKTFLDWLEGENVPFITSVDTRQITKRLRELGTVEGAIHSGEKIFPPLAYHSLVENVSIKKPETISKGSKRIIAVDCGMKNNIVRELCKRDLEIVRVPFDYDYTDDEFDGIFVSNGPGDPADVEKTAEILKKAMKKEKPIFGICLGAQLMALAAGGKTYKLKFGHRGHNQPCQNIQTKQSYITSQNHGYAIDENSLPKEWKTTFINLNDGSVEGIAHKKKPFFAVQFHPEAAPGPCDTHWLFDQFRSLL